VTRRAVVTGGAGAIGAAIVRILSEAGLRVAVCARTLDAASSAAGAEAFAGDLADPAAIDRMTAAIAAAGPVDVLVNCAGWGESRPFLETAPETWDMLTCAPQFSSPTRCCRRWLSEDGDASC
jgi:NAD(P)-dependent dehydrogenase (short-subunit alcohol dehydrogenase family)